MNHFSSGKNLEAQTGMVVALKQGKGFPEHLGDVTLFETHISWVFLAGPYAYKIKKSLDLGFLDFSTLEKRRYYCEEEIRLNRRTAPDIYVDVVPIGGTYDAPVLYAEPAIEYAVRMRRFSVEAEMDKLTESGKVQPQHIDSLAAVLAQFHGNLSDLIPDPRFGSSAEVCAIVTQNFEQLPVTHLDSIGAFVVAALEDATEDEFQACEAVIANRREAGFVRECHGDLHLGNVVIIDGKAVPFDGIEFSPALRWIDIICDTAFPFMDFLYYGRIDFAYRFLNGWLERTGDYAGLALLPLYASYRAAVRAKVSLIRASQSGVTDDVRFRGIDTFYKYFSLACNCLVRQMPALIITHGLPGSGKTSFSQAALERYGAIRIRSDVERKRLYGLAATDSSRSSVGENIYQADATARTYQHLYDLAHDLLKSGYRVIVDAAFLKESERKQFRHLASSMHVPFVIASIQAEDAAMRERIELRIKQGRDASEADVKVLEALQASCKPLEDHERSCTITFFNNGSSGFDAGASGWKFLEEVLG